MSTALSLPEIQYFLDSFAPAARRRGNHIYANGGVLNVSCDEEGIAYRAVVRGGQDYQVTLDYLPEESIWCSDCTCPVMQECKHAYAAMLAVKAHASTLKEGSTVTLGSPNFTSNPNAQVLRAQGVPSVRQPAVTPVAKALTSALGRPLERVEGDYVHRVQWLFENVRRGHQIKSSELSELSTIKDFGWENVTPWDSTPADDLEMWLYLAWELKRREWPYPSFMDSVTDFAPIKAKMEARERGQRIQEWEQNFRYIHTNEQPRSPVDFRVAIRPESPVIHWSSMADGKIKSLKQSHIRDFANAHRAGKFVVVPEAIPIWLAVYAKYDDYRYRFTELAYDDPETIQMLNQLLRVPSLSDRIVGSTGAPLARRTERLSYHVKEARDEKDDYEITLALVDSISPQRIVAVLPGSPSLYLTDEAIFEGPQPHKFGLREPLRIPAPALENADGISFLRQHAIDLPPRLAARLRPVKTVVRLKCNLRQSLKGEELTINATAHREGAETAFCYADGWMDNAGQSNAGVKGTPGHGFVYVEDKSALELFPGRLQNLGAKWDRYGRRWSLRVSKKFPEVFLPWLQSLPPGVEVRLDPVLATLRESPLLGSVNLDVQEAGVDWFDLKVTLNISDTTLTPEELNLLLNARGGCVRLGKKGWRRLDCQITDEEDKTLANLGLNARDFTAEPQRLHALQLADQAARKFLPAAQAEQIHRRASELKARVTPSVPRGIRAELRPYQIEGFHFLAYLAANRFGGVLADDMGLGKTVQTLTWLAWLRSGGVDVPAVRPGSPGGALVLMPSLVVCPKSVMDNWRAEAEKFCAGMRVRLWGGEDASVLESARADADLIVLNYPQLRALSPQIAQHRWQAVILDEAQYIKNPDSQTAQAARALQGDHRLALTGTPIENRLLDLWSILAFAMPGVLGSRAQFGRQYNQQDDPLARRRLAARVRPFLLRRAKSQVAQDLPDRIEDDLFCDMEGEQKTLYRAEFKRAQQMLLSVTTQRELNEQRFNFLTSLLRLRQICCHPALVNTGLHKAESAKLNALLELIEPLMDEGHKVLVFSQFVTMLDILRDTVKQRGWNHFYLAGETENRGELVAEFQNAPGAAVFLISLKAGGFGLNLTAASYVVLFDPWWNPAVENQAIDRTHRIGQTSKVMAYRLLIKDSIEQKIRQLQKSKAALAEDVLGEERFSQSLTLDDLRFLFAN